MVIHAFLATADWVPYWQFDPTLELPYANQIWALVAAGGTVGLGFWIGAAPAAWSVIIGYLFLQSAIMVVLHVFGIRTPGKPENAKDLYRAMHVIKEKLLTGSQGNWFDEMPTKQLSILQLVRVLLTRLPFMPTVASKGNRVYSPADGDSLNDLLIRIRGEFLEMPGMRLKREEAQRLWGLHDATLDAVLGQLVESKFLVRTGDGNYTRSE